MNWREQAIRDVEAFERGDLGEAPQSKVYVVQNDQGAVAVYREEDDAERRCEELNAASLTEEYLVDSFELL